jgi:hypothetical protein
MPFTSTRRHTILPAEVPSARRQETINPPQADKHCEKHFRKTPPLFLALEDDAAGGAN